MGGGHAPGDQHRAPQRREQAHPPVAQLVAGALHQHGPVVRHRAGGGTLVVEVAEQVLRREPVEAVPDAEPLQRLGAGRGAQLADHPPDPPAELHRPRRRVAVPERHLAGLAGSGGDQHAIVRDLLDPPARGAEEERLPHARLVDHLLVQLPDPRLPLLAARQEDAVEAAVRDGAAVHHRHAARALPRPQHARHPVPGDARPELGQRLRGIAAGEQIEDALEDGARQLGERRGAADHLEQRVDRPVVERDHRHDLLGEDVEGVAGVADRLHVPRLHGLRHPGARHQIGPVLREDHAAAGRAHLVAGAPDPLQPARHRRRRLDLHHQVDGAHVDAELERGGGHQRPDPPRLEVVLDLQPLQPRDGAVVRPHEHLARQLVQRARQPLRHAPAVHEQERRVVRPDERQQARVDGGPDRQPGPEGARGRRPGGRAARRGGPCPRRAPRPGGRGPSARRRPPPSPGGTPPARSGRGARPAPPGGRPAPARSAAPAPAPGAPRARARKREQTRRHRGSAPPRRAAAAWRRGRSAAAGARPAAPAARARARGGRRAWWARARGSRPRSPPRPSGAPRARRR